MKLKLPKMRVPLFNCGDIYFCKDEEELVAFNKKFKLPEPDIKEQIAGFATTIENQTTGHRNYLIAIFDNDISTVAHEAAHVAFYICRDVGIKVDPQEANETFCYLITAIVEFISKHIEN